MNGRTRVIAATVGALAGLGVLTGCMGGGHASRTAAGEAPAREGSAVESSDLRADASPYAEGINISGYATSVSGHEISTPCFDFTVPGEGFDWQFQEQVAACQVDVTWEASNPQIDLFVYAQIGDTSPGAIKQAIWDFGPGFLVTSGRNVDGHAGQLYEYTDSQGVPHLFVMVEVPPGRFHLHGEAITGILVGGEPNGPELYDLIDDIIQSMEIH